MSKNIVNLKGREFNLETQGAEFLAKAFGITLYQARFVLAGVGVDYLEKVVSSLRESWKRIKKETDKTAYMRGIVEKVAAVDPLDVQTAIEPAKPTRPTPPPVPPGPLPFSSMPVNEPAAVQEPAKTVQAPAGPVPQAPAAHEPAPPTGTETDDSNRARRDRILTKAFDHMMGRGQIGNNTYTLMDFSNHLDMKTNLWNVRMHLYDMIRRGLVRLVGPGVYAAVPEWQRVTPVPPVPQDAYEHEEILWLN